MKWKGRSGVTLLEIMFALIILAISMIPIAGIMGVGFRGTSKDFRSLVAIQALESTMRQVLAADYATIPIGEHNSPLDISGEAAASYTLALGNIATAGLPLKVSLTVEEIAVTMKYKPIRVEMKDFNPNLPDTWIFGEETKRELNGKNTVQPFRFKKIEGKVSWTEPEMENASKTVYMVTYLAKLED